MGKKSLSKILVDYFSSFKQHNMTLALVNIWI